MLKYVREKPRGAARDTFAVLVVRFNSRLFRSRHHTPHTTEGETPFVLIFFAARDLDDLWIDIDLISFTFDRIRSFTRISFIGNNDLFVRMLVVRDRFAGDDKKLQRFADLGSRERDAIVLFCEQCFHLTDQFFYLRAAYIANRNRASNRSQARIFTLG